MYEENNAIELRNVVGSEIKSRQWNIQTEPREGKEIERKLQELNSEQQMLEESILTLQDKLNHVLALDVPNKSNQKNLTEELRTDLGRVLNERVLAESRMNRIVRSIINRLEI